MCRDDESSSDEQFHIRHEWLDCDACGKANPLQRCARCRTVYYCDQNCQKKAWIAHKLFCVPIEVMHRRHATVGEAVPKSPDDCNDDPCGICLSEDMEQPLVLPDCGHAFCLRCLQQYQEYLRPGEPLACPYCRTETTSVQGAVVERARLYAARAGRLDFTESHRQKCYDLALAELEQLPEQNEGLFTKAEIQLGTGHPEQALQTLKRYLKAAQESTRREESAQKLMEQANLASSLEEATRLQEEAFRAAEVPGGRVPLQGRGETKYFSIYLKMAEAKQAMGDWNGALGTYTIKILAAMVSATDGTADEQQKMWMGMSRCLYELGHYQKAIEAGQAALKRNRHIAGVHEYVALAQKASGDVEGAKKTLMRAIVYESPWDEDHTMKLKELYRSTFDGCE